MSTDRPRGYGQFCPVAKAAEIVTLRWMPLVLRELLVGTTRFNDLRRGVPLMSPSLLSQRLRQLEDAGVVERRVDGRSTEYRLTEAGEELRPIIVGLGAWGHRWVQSEVAEEDLDAGLLMWDMHRRIRRDALPPRQVVVRFDFTDQPADTSRYWLVLEPEEVDVCMTDPGFEVDLEVRTTLALMAAIWMGHVDMRRALGPELEIRGPRALVRALPDWLRLSVFAEGAGAA